MSEKTPAKKKVAKKKVTRKPKDNIIMTPRGDVFEKDSTPTVRGTRADTTPKPKADEMVTILIDREMTSGGIRVNGKLFVGYVKVDQNQADDLLRIQEEHFETKKKLLNPNINVRMKSDFQKEMLFLADPEENEQKKNFTRDYGLLGRREWELCNDILKQQLLDMRMQLYGY